MGVMCIISHLTPSLTLPLTGGGNYCTDLLRSYTLSEKYSAYYTLSGRV